jgi:hypothetical protein
VLAAFAAGVVTPGLAGPVQAASPDSYNIELLDADALEDAVRKGRTCTLHYFGEEHELVLEPVNLRSSHFRVQSGSQATVLADPPRTYKGTIVGKPNSHVRLSTGIDGIRGCIRDEDGWTFIEPAKVAQQVVPEAHKVYTDLDLDGLSLGRCSEPIRAASVDPSASTGSHALTPHVGLESSPAIVPAGEFMVLELAVDVDVEFFLTYGNNWLAEIEAILNVVDGIYQAELGITIEIVMARAWEVEPDPYNETESGRLLQEFRNHWNVNEGAVARDVVHLFTGKNLDNNIVGIAHVGAVCSQTVGYALSQDLASDALMPLLVSHEIGHNLDADHDPQSDPVHRIMYPFLGGNVDEFSDESKASIDNYVGNVSCLANTQDEAGGGASTDTGGGGGGGGGPLDPLTLVVIGGALAWSQRARRV